MELSSWSRMQFRVLTLAQSTPSTRAMELSFGRQPFQDNTCTIPRQPHLVAESSREEPAKAEQFMRFAKAMATWCGPLPWRTETTRLPSSLRLAFTSRMFAHKFTGSIRALARKFGITIPDATAEEGLRRAYTTALFMFL